MAGESYADADEVGPIIGEEEGEGGRCAMLHCHWG